MGGASGIVWFSPFISTSSELGKCRGDDMMVEIKTRRVQWLVIWEFHGHMESFNLDDVQKVTLQSYVPFNASNSAHYRLYLLSHTAAMVRCVQALFEHSQLSITF